MEAFESHAESLISPPTGQPSLGTTSLSIRSVSGYKYNKTIRAPSNFKSTSTSASASDALAASEGEPICWIASMTKIITSISVFQCVEKGLLDLDEEVDRVLPELARDKLRAFTGFDTETGEPVIVSVGKERGLTLRTLLTHHSGLSRQSLHPLKQYYVDHPEKVPEGWIAGDDTNYTTLLAHEPHKKFHYGGSLDWAGRMVERVSGLKLGAYFEKHIFLPLGIKDTAFDISQRHDMTSRILPATLRTEKGLEETPIIPPFVRNPPEGHNGGGGLWGNASEFSDILLALMDGKERLLKRETVDMLFEPRLDDEAAFRQRVVDRAPSLNFSIAVFGSLPFDTKVNFGYGGLITLQDVKGLRRSGSLSWSGLPNCNWWIDRQTGICGCSTSQMLPPGDRQSADLFTEFEKAAYIELESERKKDRAHV